MYLYRFGLFSFFPRGGILPTPECDWSLSCDHGLVDYASSCENKHAYIDHTVTAFQGNPPSSCQAMSVQFPSRSKPQAILTAICRGTALLRPHYIGPLPYTKATVQRSHFWALVFGVARGHSREWPTCSFAVLSVRAVLTPSHLETRFGGQITWK